MRCRACDSILKPNEIIWIEEYNTHEELCRKCRDTLHHECDIDIVYDADTEPDTMED